MSWGFYGRELEQAALQEILGRPRWAFIKIEGRRRIGKTSLIQRCLPRRFQDKALYLQIPDSTPAGVLSRFNGSCPVQGV